MLGVVCHLMPIHCTAGCPPADPRWGGRWRATPRPTRWWARASRARRIEPFLCRKHLFVEVKVLPVSGPTATFYRTFLGRGAVVSGGARAGRSPRAQHGRKLVELSGGQRAGGWLRCRTSGTRWRNAATMYQDPCHKTTTAAIPGRTARRRDRS